MKNNIYCYCLSYSDRLNLHLTILHNLPVGTGCLSASHLGPAGREFCRQLPPRTTISYWYEMVEKVVLGSYKSGY
ncbi:hypothetical protein OUZ56_006644 [Daphnia magna]|uniref:Uncharacterized protein n=1 Tax=Daphnia magna TaxID=35525 RepID=A0ABQ9YXK0_9CRUS|nr:hypothetical protein OUZ56_006644 [Daphnia magna]